MRTHTHSGSGGLRAPAPVSQTIKLVSQPVRIMRPFAGTVDTVLVKVGQPVKKGDGLLSVQSDELAAIKIRYREAHDKWLRDSKALDAVSGARNIPVYPEEKDFVELMFVRGRQPLEDDARQGKAVVFRSA